MNQIKTFFNTIWDIKNTIFFNILALGAVTLVLVQMVIFLTSFYTLHGESVEVPNLVNMNIEEASKLLATRQLNFEIMDSVCQGNNGGGFIQEQSPKPSARIKENRTIYLTVSQYNKCTVNLYYHQIIGRSQSHVLKHLERSNLKIGKIDFRTGNKAINTVTEILVNGKPLFTEIDPNSNEKPSTQPKAIPYNAVVDLVVWRESDMELIPDLFCKSFGEAEFVIKAKLFNVGTIHADGILDTASAYIISQNPTPNVVSSIGAGIELWLTTEEPKCPDQSGGK